MVSIRQFGAINRTYRHITRYRAILRVLLKYGFSDLIEYLHLDQYLESGLQLLKRKPKTNEQLFRHSRPERLRMALEELGPTFIKLGQLLSTRSDFVPPEYIEELAKLQDRVPPFSYPEVEQIFQEEWGGAHTEFLSDFSSEPVAAASISQVHHARLMVEDEDGIRRERKVVVKIQRPGIDKIIAVDLEILSQIAGFIEDHLEEMQGHQPTAIVKEFARSLFQEIDFTIELTNIQHFARQFVGNKDIYIPEVFPAFSTERILIMERIEGIKASNIQELWDKGYNLPLIAERGARLVMEQVFVHGFFHADPHPGNIFILPNNVVCFIDFGQMGRLLLRDREDFTDLVINIAAGNENKVAAGILKMTTQKEEPNRESLTLDISDFMRRYVHLAIGELEITKLHKDLLRLLSRHRLFLKPSMYLMLKALGTVEGVGLLLHPKLELLSLAKPFMKKIQMNRVNPKRMAESLRETGGQYLDLFHEFPVETRSILSQLRQGRLKIEIEHRGLRSLERSLSRASNRISFAIVLAALIIGSSLIVLSKLPPNWHGIPVIGLIGFLVAGIMGFWLLISIIRQGKL